MHVFVVLRVIIIKDKLKKLIRHENNNNIHNVRGSSVCSHGTKRDTGQEAQQEGEKTDGGTHRSALNAEAVQAINDTAFTIEADKVEFKRGYTAHVTASTNFVAVSGSNAIVQVAFNVPVSGFNGLGGITLEGIVTGYKISSDKKGNTYVKLSVSGKGISAQLFISLWKDANKATVNIQPNFNSNKLTLSGMLWKPERSNIFKGTTF